MKKSISELERLQLMCKYESDAYGKGYRRVAGIDEAGRGPLAGPVVAACVMLPENCIIEGLDDSKKLSPGKRERLYGVIEEKAISLGIGIADENCIDSINILNATKLAMIRALKKMGSEPDILLVDAVKLDGIDIPQLSLVKGDTISISIAAASIVAKVTRDKMITEIDALYPQYGFKKHKGYGTREHIEAIKKYGICPIHRVSFTKKFI